MGNHEGRLGAIFVQLFQCRAPAEPDADAKGNEAPLLRRSEDERGEILVPCLDGTTFADFSASLEWRLSQFFIFHGPLETTTSDVGDTNGTDQAETVPLLPTQQLSAEVGAPTTQTSYYCHSCDMKYGPQTHGSAADRLQVKVCQLLREDSSASSGVEMIRLAQMRLAVPLSSRLVCFFALVSSDEAPAAQQSGLLSCIAGSTALPSTALGELQLPSQLTVQLGDAFFRVGSGADGHATLMNAVVGRLHGYGRRARDQLPGEVVLPAHESHCQPDPELFFVDPATGSCVLPCERVAVIAALVSTLHVVGPRAELAEERAARRIRSTRRERHLAQRGPATDKNPQAMGSVISMSDMASGGTSVCLAGDTYSSDQELRLSATCEGGGADGLLCFPTSGPGNTVAGSNATEETFDSDDTMTFGFQDADERGQRHSGTMQFKRKWENKEVYYEDDDEDEENETNDAVFVYGDPTYSHHALAAPSHSTVSTRESSVATLVNRSTGKLYRAENSGKKPIAARSREDSFNENDGGSQKDFEFDTEQEAPEYSSDLQPEENAVRPLVSQSFELPGNGLYSGIPEPFSDNSNSVHLAQRRSAATPPPSRSPQTPLLQTCEESPETQKACTPVLLTAALKSGTSVGARPLSSGRKRTRDESYLRSSPVARRTKPAPAPKMNGDTSTPTPGQPQQDGRKHRTPILFSPGSLLLTSQRNDSPFTSSKEQYQTPVSRPASRELHSPAKDNPAPARRCEMVFYTPEGSDETGLANTKDSEDSSDTDGPITIRSARPLGSAPRGGTPAGSLAFASAAQHPSHAQNAFLTPRRETNPSQRSDRPQDLLGNEQHPRRLALLSPQSLAPSPLQAFQPVVRPTPQAPNDPAPSIMVTQQQLPEYVFSAADDSQGDEEEDEKGSERSDDR